MATERAKQKKKTDTVFSKFIRQRDRDVCIDCGRPAPAVYRMDCGHLYSRGHDSTRWNEKNAAAQCSGCNDQHNRNHRAMEDRMIVRHGRPGIDMVYELWNRTKEFKITTPELKEIEAYYKARIKGEMYGLPERLKPYVGLR